MRRSRKPITIASRQSLLARAQAELVGRALGKLHPGVEIDYHWVETDGDRLQSASLAGHGGKGLFIKAVEQAVLLGKADVAVHSLKDMPVEETPGLTLAAIGKRTDVADCLVSVAGHTDLNALPDNAVVGTSAPRRAAQLLRLRPDLRIVPMRGNVDTRVRKTLNPEQFNGDSQPVDATLLSVAGLIRAGLAEHATHKLDLQTMMPAASQAALAIQCRADDHVTLTRCLPLNHAATATAVHAERQVVAGLGGDCHSPIAAYAEPCEAPGPVKRNADAHWFRLRVRALSPDGRQVLEADDRVLTKELRRLVKRVIDELLEQGARPMVLGRSLPPRPVTSPPPRATVSHAD